jgi:antibiotic biosynthesis monooxygenase (ABM) superfamily enzyme
MEFPESSLLDDGALSEETVASFIVTFQVKPKKSKEFEKWIKKIEAVSREKEGYVNVVVMKPDVSKTQVLYVVLIQFASRDLLESWINSEERSKLLKETDALIVKGTEPKGEVLVTSDQMELWNKVAMPSSALHTPKPPPKWKLVILITIHVYWMCLTSGLGAMISQGIPYFWALCIWLLLLVSAIQYILLPVTMRLFGWWLFSPRTSFACEPLRSLDEGLCCFARNMV